MPPKRSAANPSTTTVNITPAAASPRTTAASTKPSSAVSSKPLNSTSASLKSSSTQASSSGTLTPQHNAGNTSTSTSTSTSRTTTGGNANSKGSSSVTSSSSNNAQDILQTVWSRYVRETPQRVKIVDVFMAFLVVVGGLQFVYCVIAGNYPFNAFLSGFSATVGQFVLTVSLRIQTNPLNKAEFSATSDERAFADYVFGSLLLHFFCVNFIN